MGKIVNFTPELRAEYTRTYAAASIRPECRAEVARVVGRIMPVWPRYELVAEETGVPAVVVALIHTMECGGLFDRHLHNGDSLRARTTHVPSGRPVSGSPPFAWETSAADALSLHHLDTWPDWSVPGICYVLERYNGWGYRYRGVVSPYLFSYTTAYHAGKYTSDGRYNPNAVSKQPGAMAIYRALADAGWLSGDVAAVDVSTAYPGVLLRHGSRGEDVRRAQARLIELGYDIGKAGADGKYGGDTSATTAAYQRDKGLDVDGVVGRDTWLSLFGGAS